MRGAGGVDRLRHGLWPEAPVRYQDSRTTAVPCHSVGSGFDESGPAQTVPPLHRDTTGDAPLPAPELLLRLDTYGDPSPIAVVGREGSTVLMSRTDPGVLMRCAPRTTR
jgi:hypothetical protein